MRHGWCTSSGTFLTISVLQVAATGQEYILECNSSAIGLNGRHAIEDDKHICDLVLRKMETVKSFKKGPSLFGTKVTISEEQLRSRVILQKQAGEKDAKKNDEKKEAKEKKGKDSEEKGKNEKKEEERKKKREEGKKKEEVAITEDAVELKPTYESLLRQVQNLQEEVKQMQEAKEAKEREEKEAEGKKDKKGGFLHKGKK